ncbi:MAG TPA: hypothetical protein VFZ61_10760 [Polyangiales bacterium]
MRAFLSGFLVASGLWGALAFLYLRGQLDFMFPEEEPAPVTAAAPVDPETVGPPTKGKRRGLKRPRVQRNAQAAGADSPRNGDSAGSGTTTIGDDLGWDKQRNLDMAAGEAQLSGTQIDAGFDSVMGRIRRCLILVPSDGDVTGKLLFGMRVGGDGKPRAVNLSGPSIVISGESGSCLRGAAQNIRFPSFDGPDMLFKYPITLQ